MTIKCKGSKAFHLNIDIENYYEAIKKMGLDITIPLTIEVPCPKCKMIEVYEIYPTTYEHVSSYKKEKDK